MPTRVPSPAGGPVPAACAGAILPAVSSASALLGSSPSGLPGGAPGGVQVIARVAQVLHVPDGEPQRLSLTQLAPSGQTTSGVEALLEELAVIG